MTDGGDGLHHPPGASSLRDGAMAETQAERVILVPLNLLPAGEAKLPVAVTYAKALGARLLLLHVLPDRAGSGSSVSEVEAYARAYLDTMVARVRTEGAGTESLVQFGPVARAVIATAQAHSAELIIIGSNTRANIGRLLLGAIADEIIRLAPCPVLLVRPQLENTPPLPVVRNFAEDAANAGTLASRPLSIRPVEVARIIGSIGRSNDLGADFRPLHRSADEEERYRCILDAFQRGTSLPPVDLYKLGYGYYVLDGHHRVAVAKQLGQLWIDASLVEYIPTTDASAQRAFTERIRFERATGLNRVGASRPATYNGLETWIHEFAGEQHLTDLREAARRWYADVFRPLQVRIRRQRLSQHFPGERTADIVLRIAEHRKREQQRTGEDVSWEDALASFDPALRPTPDGQ